MIRYTPIALMLCLLTGTAVASGTPNEATEQTTQAPQAAQTTTTANGTAVAEPSKVVEDKNLLQQAQDKAANIGAAAVDMGAQAWDTTADTATKAGQAAADMGANAWDSTSDTAAKAGAATVDVGKSALDAVGDAAAAAGNYVNNALDFEDSDEPAAETE